MVDQKPWSKETALEVMKIFEWNDTSLKAIIFGKNTFLKARVYILKKF